MRRGRHPGRVTFTIDHIVTVGGAIALVLLVVERFANLAERGVLVPGRIGRWWHSRAARLVALDQQQKNLAALAPLSSEIVQLVLSAADTHLDQQAILRGQAQITADLDGLKATVARIPAMERTLTDVHTELYPNHGQPSMSDRVTTAVAMAQESADERREFHAEVVGRLNTMDDRLSQGEMQFMDLRSGQRKVADQVDELAGKIANDGQGGTR